MSSKVVPVKECQICFEIHKIKDVHCWARDDDHVICTECFDKESKRRTEIGIQAPNECFICKPFQERVEKITVNSIDHITVAYGSIRHRLISDNCVNTCSLITILCFCFILLNLR